LRTADSNFLSIGQRRRRSRTTASITRRSMSAAAIPRRVVSTSGSSGRSEAARAGAYLIFDSL
jgi:hypothetical protein